MNYCFLDLETTGLDAKKDSIIEVSFFVQNENKNELCRFDEVFVPEKSPLSKYVTHITGITEEEIHTRGKTLSQEKETLRTLIGDAVIIGHNIGFDIGFLKENGILEKENPYIDTHELARIVLIGEESYALEILAEKYGFTHTSAHRAMSDVEASAELFYFLKEKIAQLPEDFLRTIRPILEKKSDWFAKSFFLDTQGGEKAPSIPKDNTKLVSLPPNEKTKEALQELSSSDPLFVPQGDSSLSAQALLGMAEFLAEQGKKVCILSPKLDFFKGIKRFPTPEVLLDPTRLTNFSEKRSHLIDSETVFFLQCSFRHFLGLRGKELFDLFTNQRKLWEEICVSKKESEVFASVLQNRKDENILVSSPRGFLRFHELDLFQNRILLIDESEIFANQLLFLPAQNYSLLPFLESEDTSVAAHFFISQVCRDIIEPHLGHTVGPFPEKTLLQKHESFPDLAQAIQSISSETEDLKSIADILSPPEKNNSFVRWVQYFPETGNLTLSTWNPQDWRDLKNALSAFPKIFFFRHKLDPHFSFFRVFTGVDKGIAIEDERITLKKKLIVPEKLESANDPQFNQFCADKIIELAKGISQDHALAVNFSSLATLKSVFEIVSEKFLDSDVSVFGEKMSGGDAKLFQLLSRSDKILLFTQKLLSPALLDVPIKTLVVQKFPFPPPHPLLKEIETSMKQSNQSFWDIWTVPHVSSNISRRISVYPNAKKVIWLDPRENSRWGKAILKTLF